jgi:hypothetical protein
MRRHNGRLFRVARAILRDDAEAEDTLQEAYFDAYRHIGSFRGGATLATWLPRIVTVVNPGAPPVGSSDCVPISAGPRPGLQPPPVAAPYTDRAGFVEAGDRAEQHVQGRAQVTP